MRYFGWLFLLLLALGCEAKQNEGTDDSVENDLLEFQEDKKVSLYQNDKIKVGADRITDIIPMLKGKKVGVVGNQSSTVQDVHLVDTLLSSGIQVVKVFSPEHGFRGDADAGERVQDGLDEKTGLSIISLYGKNKKPRKDQLQDIDMLVFDIQDVGARFYTYISTLNYVMEAAAENNIDLIILDRPNPNGHYVDGPVLREGFDSFIGMNKVPVVHGMTIGEYARMVKGEHWINKAEELNLQVISCENYTHSDFYELPIPPSPNLPNMRAIYWYPSLCFFEGTVVSIGRGTDLPFQCAGHPEFEVDVLDDLHQFKPTPNFGSKHPKLDGEWCYGYDFTRDTIVTVQQKGQLDLSVLIEFYGKIGSDDFFLSNNFFNLLAGNEVLKQQIVEGKSEDEIRATWAGDLETFKLTRKKYLLYEDFE